VALVRNICFIRSFITTTPNSLHKLDDNKIHVNPSSKTIIVIFIIIIIIIISSSSSLATSLLTSNYLSV